MPIFEKGAWYWYETEQESWIPVKMHAAKDGQIMARSPKTLKGTGEDQYLLDEKMDLARVNESSLMHVENMVAMEELSEAAILHNLRMRFEEDVIYTYISSILVSVNPFKMLPIYSPSIMTEYRDALKKGLEKPPHCYALAHETFHALSSEGRDQSVIISGESGAGKTEATKLVLQYMAEMSGQGSDVEQQLLESNPIVEAFGNAKTVRNNNSSRFGKWIAITFDDKFHIHGAKITNYLLEKSRIVTPGKGERNYHAFYQLAKGASPEWKQEFFLDDVETFNICSMGECVEVQGIDDVREYEEALNAMDVLQFSEDDKKDIWRTTAAVMHLGNIKVDNDKKDKAFIVNKDVLEKAAKLLGTTAANLEGGLVSQSKMMGKEKVLTVLNAAQARDNLLAMAKAVYGNMFDWLIQRINNTLFKHIDKFYLVGVLDIFGFEIFEDNRFEQFSINFANEKMQQHFNEHIFAMEQNEYKSDQIDVAHVEFIDNQACLDVIEKSKVGILAMCDEELKLPKGSDSNLLERMHKAYKENKFYVAPRGREQFFGINHYAGEVTYQIGWFCSKNKDELGLDAAECLKGSLHSFIQGLAPTGGRSTVGSQFKSQLKNLMSALKATDPHFIRCIKSNNIKVADNFDGPMVLRQLQYLGLKEVVNIRQLGYPIRRLHGDFVKRYSLLTTTKSTGNDAQDCAALLTELAIDKEQWRVGLTKVFVRTSVQKTLDKKRELGLTQLMIDLQAFARAKVIRSRYLRVLKASDDLTRIMANVQSPEELDAAIESYELLQMNLKPALLQSAVALRNLMYKQRSALKSLVTAIASRSRENLLTAMQSAKDCELDQLPEGKVKLVEAQALYEKIVAFRKLQADAFAARELEMVKQSVAQAAGLEFDGPLEQQARALVTKLEEEAHVKSKLQDAMKSKDLETLKKTLEIAMSLQSGSMVGSAVERALALGLADDPMVKIAIEAMKNMEHEVAVHKMAEEIEGAISTRDKNILLFTVQAAKDKGLGELPQVIQAEKVIVELEKEEDLRQKLQDAISNRDLEALISAIAEAEAGGVGDSAECDGARAEVEDIKRVKRELKEAEDRAKKEEEERKKREAAEKKAREIKEAAAAAAAREALRKAHLDREAADRKIREEQELAAAAIQLAEEHADAEALKKAQMEAERASKAAAQALVMAKAAEEKAQHEEEMRQKMYREEEEKRERTQAAEQKERDRVLGEKVAAATALGLKHDRETAMARAQQESQEKRAQCLKGIENAIKDQDLAQLTFMLKRARGLDIPTSNEIFRVGQESLNELRDAQELRDKELAEAAAATDAEDLIPIEKPAAIVVEQKSTFDAQVYSGDDFRFTKYPNMRTPNDFAEGRFLYKTKLKKGMFRWSKEVIGKSLTALHPDKHNEATSAFRAIMSYMGDRQQSFPESAIKEMVDKMSMEAASNGVRNEVYCQVMKQLSSNKKMESEIQGWRLMAILAERVPPDASLLNYVLNFIHEHKEGAYDDVIKAYATYTLEIIEKTWQKWQAPSFTPSQVDVQAISDFRTRTMDSDDILIDFPDGSELKIRVNPWESNEVLIPRVCNMVGMSDQQGITIMEYSNETFRMIKGDECVLDVQNKWQLEKKEEVREQVLKKKGFVFMRARATSGVNRFVLVNGVGETPPPARDGKTYYPTESKDAVKNHLMIAQGARDFVMGRQELKQEEAVTFAAMAKKMAAVIPLIGQAKVLNEDEKDDAWANTKLWDVPLTFKRKIDDPTWENLVKTATSEPAVANVTVASLLDSILKRRLFAAQYFRVRSNPRKLDAEAARSVGVLPPLVDLAVNHNGLFVLETASRKIINNWSLLQIMGWSHKPNTVKMKVKKAAGNKKSGVKTQFTLEFFTDSAGQNTSSKGREICELLLTYATEMVRKIEEQKKADKEKRKADA